MENCFFAQYFDFLESKENEGLLDLARNSEPHFFNSGVVDYSNDYPDWRKSKVIFDASGLTKFKSVLREKIIKLYPRVCSQLNQEQLRDFGIDIQLTSHNDGDYFKKHADIGTDNTNHRVLTFVYYFNKQPKLFSGGELVIYGCEVISIEPQNNMIVFFNPALSHEVKPVLCASKRFENGRFTLNGWITSV